MTNIFNGLFGRKQTGARDVSKLVDSLSEPAIHVVSSDTQSLSHFGGSPNLPYGFAWPECNGKRLDFLAHISLSELHHALSITWLPSSGSLLFFYDMEKQPWGFDPADRGGWAVIYVPDLPGPTAQSNLVSIPSQILPRHNVVFRRIETLPSWERDSVRALNLSAEESELLDHLVADRFNEKPKHQISGFPIPIQGDEMELECQLVTNGLYCGDPTGYSDPRATSLKAGASNWRLLFQFDSDDSLDLMWGDCGTIYYWVEEGAAKFGDFSNTWLVLQCS